MIKKILFTTIIFNLAIFSQECDEGYSYLMSLPDNINNINNDNNCFYQNDLEVLDSIYIINNLETAYESYMHMGLQTWVSGRFTTWVATYVPNGQNGLTSKLDKLPYNIGNLTNIAGLYLEKHNLTDIPESFSSLTSLVSLFISNNWLTSLPNDIGNLSNLQTLDLGYNQIESIPESIGNLGSLEYLFLFNNQLSSIPNSICNLNLDWDGISPANYPYFASGGNLLCDDSLIPDCVLNSANFNISMEQNYYSFLLEAPQDCMDCSALGDMNGDSGYNVLDIVSLANCVLAGNCADLENGCAGDMNGDGGYNVLDIVSLANCVLAGNCGS